MNKPFTFAISMSVLDHLGRNLYRSFATVLGEAISNSWDANANNVWIYIDKEKNSFFIKDDGDGMTADDFQNKFLKIGYSKRRTGETASSKGRPYIGRKGIGKLALLSCADTVAVISKTKTGEYVGGRIDNAGLDKAITEDLMPTDYPLEDFDLEAFDKLTEDHETGTIIWFQNCKEEIRNRPEYLRKMIALYFRFSLVDASFSIHLGGKKVTLDDLDDLAKNTQFLWTINDIEDPYLDEKLMRLREPKFREQVRNLGMNGGAKGFIASVKKPRHLKINSTDERVGVDLFVNGRLRERDILKHIPTDRLAVSYLYGQIHFNGLDDEKDRFTSSREGIIAEDPKYRSFLDSLKAILFAIIEDWDEWRIKNREEGDSENERITKKERASRSLYSAISKEYAIEGEGQTEQKEKVEQWVAALSDDAAFNFGSYADCFVSENLVRKFIQDKQIPLSPQADGEFEKWWGREKSFKEAGQISIDIRKGANKLSYLSMDGLANLVDKPAEREKRACLSNDAKEYKPVRDAVMHTALLTDEAKNKLSSVFANIKARVRDLLST
jgi:hypothetical protein